MRVFAVYVLCEVYDVHIFNGNKLKAEVSLIVQKPDHIIRLRLFDAHSKQGLISTFQKLKGKQIKVPIEVTIYQDRITYILSYGANPEVL